MDKTGRLAERLISRWTVRFGRLTVSRGNARVMEDLRRTMNAIKNNRQLKDSCKAANEEMWGARGHGSVLRLLTVRCGERQA